MPSSAIAMATIQRDTSIVLRRHATTDTLIFEETAYNRHGLAGARRTWYVQIPANLPVGEVLRFNDDDPSVIAWFREEAPGFDSHAVRAGGSVQIHARQEKGVDATVVLRAITAPTEPGMAVAPAVTTSRRALWVYDAPGAPVTPALDTNEN
ncbi:MAG: hypothetical protein Tsb0013_12740 [Phycisphaerales bacterium]